MPVSKRTALARALLAHGEDKDDPYIPLLIWYGIEPVVGADPKAALDLAKVSKLPKVTEFIYRRMGAEEAGRTGLLKLAAESSDPAQRQALLNTVLLAARAGNKIALPTDWSAQKTQLGSSNTITELEAFMGIAAARATFRATVADEKANLADRENAIALLTRVRDAETAPLLLRIVEQAASPAAATQPIRRAVQALATLPHPATAKTLVTHFASLNTATQQDAINALATSVSGATALLAAVQAKTVPSTSLSPFLARQIDAFDDAGLKAQLKEVFGDLNAPRADLAERKVKYRALLTTDVLAKSDKAKGKMIFNAICGQCHKLFGEGQSVGPDLTGSNRATLDYLLDNVLDPNAVIGKAYQLNLFELNDGRVTSGVIKEETPAAYHITMPGGLEQTLTVAEVKKRTISKASTMPEGLFDALPPETLQQLVAYLQTNASPASATGNSTAQSIPGALEGETLKILGLTGKGQTSVQGMGSYRNSVWSAGQQLWWKGGKTGDALTLSVPVAATGRYKISAALTEAIDYGIASVKLNGQAVGPGPIDCYHEGVVSTGPLDWGTLQLEAGEAKLEITLTGLNAAAKGSMVGLDYVKMEKQ
jgi:putative heme-binding domain-containing protein